MALPKGLTGLPAGLTPVDELPAGLSPLPKGLSPIVVRKSDTGITLPAGMDEIQADQSVDESKEVPVKPKKQVMMVANPLVPGQMMPIKTGDWRTEGMAAISNAIPSKKKQTVTLVNGQQAEQRDDKAVWIDESNGARPGTKGWFYLDEKGAPIARATSTTKAFQGMKPILLPGGKESFQRADGAILTKPEDFPNGKPVGSGNYFYWDENGPKEPAPEENPMGSVRASTEKEKLAARRAPTPEQEEGRKARWETEQDKYTPMGNFENTASQIPIGLFQASLPGLAKGGMRLLAPVQRGLGDAAEAVGASKTADRLWAAGNETDQWLAPSYGEDQLNPRNTTGTVLNVAGNLGGGATMLPPGMEPSKALLPTVFGAEAGVHSYDRAKSEGAGTGAALTQGVLTGGLVGGGMRAMHGLNIPTSSPSKAISARALMAAGGGTAQTLVDNAAARALYGSKRDLTEGLGANIAMWGGMAGMGLGGDLNRIRAGVDVAPTVKPDAPAKESVPVVRDLKAELATAISEHNLPKIESLKQEILATKPEPVAPSKTPLELATEKYQQAKESGNLQDLLAAKRELDALVPRGRLATGLNEAFRTATPEEASKAGKYGDTLIPLELANRFADERLAQDKIDNPQKYDGSVSPGQQYAKTVLAENAEPVPSREQRIAPVTEGLQLGDRSISALEDRVSIAQSDLDNVGPMPTRSKDIQNWLQTLITRTNEANKAIIDAKAMTHGTFAGELELMNAKAAEIILAKAEAAYQKSPSNRIKKIIEGLKQQIASAPTGESEVAPAQPRTATKPEPVAPTEVAPEATERVLEPPVSTPEVDGQPALDRRVSSEPVDLDRRAMERRSRMREEVRSQKPIEKMTPEEMAQEVQRLRSERMLSEKIPDMANERAFNAGYEEGNPVASLDVMSLKAVNEYGQHVGDEYLIDSLGRLNRIAKEHGALAAQRGGDEALMTHADPNVLLDVVDKVNAELKANPFTFIDPKTNEQVQIQGEFHHGIHSSPEAADRAMAAAKKARKQMDAQSKDTGRAVSDDGRVLEGKPELDPNAEKGLGTPESPFDNGDSIQFLNSGLNVQHALADVLGMKRGSSWREMAPVAMEKIGRLGASVRETTIRIMEKVKGITRELADVLAKSLHESFSGSRESQLGAVGPDVKTPSRADQIRQLSEEYPGTLEKHREETKQIRETIDQAYPGPENSETRAKLKSKMKAYNPVEPASSVPENTLTPPPKVTLKEAAAGVFKKPLADIKKVLSGDASKNIDRMVNELHDGGFIQKKYVEGSGKAPDIAKSMVLDDAPVPIKDFKEKYNPGAEVFESPHNRFFEALGSNNHVVDFFLARGNGINFQNEYNRFFGDVLKPFRDSSKDVVKTMEPIFKQAQREQADYARLKAQYDADPSKDNLIKLYGRQKAIYKVLEQKMDAIKSLCERNPTSRIAIAAEFKTPGEYPAWLRLEPKEEKAAQSIREGFAKIGERLKEDGIDTIDNTDINYVTHLTKILSGKRPSFAQFKGGLPPEVMRFMHRQEGGTQWFPEIRSIVASYVPEVSSKIGEQPWLNKWQPMVNPENPTGYLNEASPNYAPNLGIAIAEHMNGIKEIQKPNLLDTLNDAARKFESVRLLGLNQRVGYKHAVGKAGSIVAEHGIVNASATKDQLKAFMANRINGKYVGRLFKSLGIDAPSNWQAKAEVMNALIAQREIMSTLRETQLESYATHPNSLKQKFGPKAAEIFGKAEEMVNKAVSKPVSSIELWENGLNALDHMAQSKGGNVGESMRNMMNGILDLNFRGGADSNGLVKSAVGRTGLMFTQTPSKIWEYRAKLIRRALNGSRDVYGTPEASKLVHHVIAIGAIYKLGSKLGINVADSILHLPILDANVLRHLKDAMLAEDEDDRRDHMAAAYGLMAEKGGITVAPSIQFLQHISQMARNPIGFVKDTPGWKQLAPIITGSPAPEPFTQSNADSKKKRWIMNNIYHITNTKPEDKILQEEDRHIKQGYKIIDKEDEKYDRQGDWGDE